MNEHFTPFTETDDLENVVAMKNEIVMVNEKRIYLSNINDIDNFA